MLCAIIRSEAGPEALGRTLAPLVRGVVEGLVEQAVVVAVPGDGDSVIVAEASGASLVEATSWGEGFALAARRTRAAAILAIDAGVLLPEAFWPELSERLAGGLETPLATRSAGGLVTRFGEFLSGRPERSRALVLPRAMATDDPWSRPLRARSLAVVTHRLAPQRR